MDTRKKLLPGQMTVGEALAKALPPLIDEAVEAMRQMDREYEEWKKAEASRRQPE